ncbi:ArsR/SmtB family transcription factor [Herbiconiux sp. UC225_62]|uniref:ArsR/SmtB family transcription factor n=1 Tax=Herbiconiux sp. UC225_62 TaxID=3350168 RepID=UPI0036D3232B
MPATDELSLVFGALADPTRRDILTRLRTGPITVGELAANYSMSRPAISQHLAVLEGAGLIVRTVNAQWRECSIREAGLDDARAWVEQHRAEWNERLDFLGDHLMNHQSRREGAR